MGPQPRSLTLRGQPERDPGARCGSTTRPFRELYLQWWHLHGGRRERAREPCKRLNRRDSRDHRGASRFSTDARQLEKFLQAQLNLPVARPNQISQSLTRSHRLRPEEPIVAGFLYPPMNAWVVRGPVWTNQLGRGGGTTGFSKGTIRSRRGETDREPGQWGGAYLFSRSPQLWRDWRCKREGFSEVQAGAKGGRRRISQGLLTYFRFLKSISRLPSWGFLARGTGVLASFSWGNLSAGFLDWQPGDLVKRTDAGVCLNFPSQEFIFEETEVLQLWFWDIIKGCGEATQNSSIQVPPVERLWVATGQSKRIVCSYRLRNGGWDLGAILGQKLFPQKASRMPCRLLLLLSSVKFPEFCCPEKLFTCDENMQKTEFFLIFLILPCKCWSGFILSLSIHNIKMTMCFSPLTRCLKK